MSEKERKPKYSFPFTWTGEVMQPPQDKYWRKRAEDRWEVGERYQLIEHQGRSQESHNHYFATISVAFSNLTDEQKRIFPTEEHLRKRALIAKGWYTARDQVFDSMENAAIVAGLLMDIDDYAVVVFNDCVVTIFQAKSQSTKAMGSRQEFQKSKQDVIDYCAHLIGVTPDQLSTQASFELA